MWDLLSFSPAQMFPLLPSFLLIFALPFHVGKMPGMLYAAGEEKGSVCFKQKQ